MPSERPEYLIESDILDNFVDVDSLSFEDITLTWIGFCHEVLLQTETLKGLNISDESLQTARELVGKAIDYFQYGALSLDELTKNRITALEIHYKAKKDSDEQHLFRIVANCLYGKEHEEDYPNDIYIDAMFSLFNDLGTGYCKLFREYAIQKLPNIEKDDR